MGKALILIVLGSSMVLTKQLYASQEAQGRTARAQRDFQEQLLAREIATSAFNLGMGEIRTYGERVREGVAALNGSTNAGRSGTYTVGKFAGGQYTVRADLTSGHSVRVTAKGYYGRYTDYTGATRWRGTFTMHDEYRVPVLIARERSVVDIRFLESMAGYCSAVFYQAYRAGMTPGTEPAPVMLFAPDNRDKKATRPPRQIIVEPGTQMNFFIAVDQNCSERPQNHSVCEARQYMDTYGLNLADYSASGTNRGSGRFEYLHYALNVQAGSLDRVSENVWGLVSQNPADRQRWRIAWEDIHNTSWNRPGSNSPEASLQALKSLGYSGLGWPTSDVFGYAQLQDFGNRPDLSDQVIEVQLYPVTSVVGRAKIDANRIARTGCGLPDDAPPDVYAPTTTAEPPPEPTTLPGETSPTPEPTTDPVPASSGSASCGCQGNRKIALMHRPPGNERNERVICVSVKALSGHRNHNDYQVCQGL